MLCTLLSVIKPNLRSMTDDEFEDELEETGLPLDDETEEDEFDGDLDEEEDDDELEDSDMM